MTAINQRNLTAFHEAGHCVVAKCFGFVLSVDIVPDLAQDRLGICMTRTAAWQRESRAYLMFGVAGPIAELIRRCRGIGWLGVHLAAEERGLLEILRLMGGNVTLLTSTQTSPRSPPLTVKPSSGKLLRTWRRC